MTYQINCNVQKNSIWPKWSWNCTFDLCNKNQKVWKWFLNEIKSFLTSKCQIVLSYLWVHNPVSLPWQCFVEKLEISGNLMWFSTEKCDLHTDHSPISRWRIIHFHGLLYAIADSLAIQATAKKEQLDKLLLLIYSLRSNVEMDWDQDQMWRLAISRSNRCFLSTQMWLSIS